MLRRSVLPVIALSAVMACDDAGGPMAGAPAAARMAGAVAGADGNTLPQNNVGNSGGVLSMTGQAAAAGVEATMVYNAGGRAQGAQVAFRNGPMEGVTVNCNRAGGGTVVPECNVTGAESAYLVNELSGNHAYAGAFAVNGIHGPNGAQDAFIAIHSSPTGAQTVHLPGETVRYVSRFQGGGSIISSGQRFSGRTDGDSILMADFASGNLSMTFNGRVVDDRTGLLAPMTAGIDNATIGPDGRFFNTADTGFTFAGQQAWGELDGAFYGPNAEEAAATFGFGNSTGGMTGIAIGCSDYNAFACVAPSPRF